MLPTTITLNIGSPAADVVFTQASRQGNEAIYFAPSPQGDLEGRPQLRVAHETTKSGLVRTLCRFSFPVYVSSTATYDGAITASHTLVRKNNAPLATADKVLEAAQEVLAVSGVRSSLGDASI